MFLMLELTKVLRQQSDESFIKLLNKIQEGNLDKEVGKALRLRFVAKGTSNHPQRAVHIFVENNPVDHRNETMSEDVDQSLVCPNATYEIPKG